MIQNNARIESFHGIRFFDQDILFDDFIYNNYVEAVLEIEYCTPGFGIVLINNTASMLSAESEAFLFRIGYREASVEYKTGYINKTLAKIPTIIYPSADINQKMYIRFRKYKKTIYLDINGESIINPKVYKLPKDINKFCIGIYSNAGNIIHNLKINSKIPDYWSINMTNTVGGRIRFYSDGFELSGCSEKAEIEQMKIALPAGTFYLKYNISKDSDIKCYAFDYDSTLIHDTQKNILSDDNTIVLDHDTIVNIKFVGTKGSVSNIILNQDPDTNYAPTKDDDIEIEPSLVTIFKNGVTKVVWSAMVSALGTKHGDPYLFCDGKYKTSYFGSNLGTFELNKIYEYTYDLESKRFSVTDNGLEICYDILSDSMIDADTFSILYNMDATLYYLNIFRDDGEVINVVTDNNKKISVPINRDEPIIITDEYNEPLNISSSYRIYTHYNNDNKIDESQDEYVFTNIERELFEVNAYGVYTVESDISDQINSVRVYGISTPDINTDNIYRVSKQINDIGIFCNNNYKQIYDITVSAQTNEITINEDTTIYNYLVIDYMKDDSYCINANFAKGTYDIDVSTSKNIKYYFGNDNSIIQKYKIISIDDISDKDSCYLCIRNNED